MQFTKKTILIGAAAAVGVAAIGGTAVAATGVVGDADRDGHEERFEQELAQRLGVPQADVERALEEIHGERLADRIDDLVEEGRLSPEQAATITQQAQAGQVDEAMTALRAAMLDSALAELVEDGKLTQTQANEAAALAAEGVPIGVRGLDHHGDRDDDKGEDRPAPSAEHQAEHLERLQADGLITTQQASEIETLIAAGKTDEAMQRLHALVDAKRLEQLVADGTITQAQADRVQALVDAGAPIGIGGPGGKGHHGDGDGKGHHGDRGGHHGDGMGDGLGGPPLADGMGGGMQGGGMEPPAGGAEGA